MPHSPETIPPNPFDELPALEPKLVEAFVPADAKAQKEAFLQGEIRNPDHDYQRLEDKDYDAVAQELDTLEGQLTQDDSLNPKFKPAYQALITTYKRRNTLMQAARDVKQGRTEAEREQAKETFMRTNKESYAEPSETVYRSLLNEKLNDIAGKQLSGPAATLRDELFALTDYKPDTQAEVHERFKPSDETVAWMHEVVQTLYGGMLKHVPEQETFTRDEIASTFTTIINEEFGDAAADWEVVIADATSINVRPASKQIIVPTETKDRDREKVNDLVVHELGVHFLRSVMGYETDLRPLAIGLSGYYDAEEGLGLIMQQARKGSFVEPNGMAYITTGATYFDNKDFRDTFEMRWRLGLLGEAKDDQATFDETAITKAKDKAYAGVMRIMRGTDELPWFKDLAYYNGSMSTWKHLESIRGDDLKFTFVLLGKANPASDEHERLMYETSTTP